MDLLGPLSNLHVFRNPQYESLPMPERFELVGEAIQEIVQCFGIRRRIIGTKENFQKLSPTKQKFVLRHMEQYYKIIGTPIPKNFSFTDLDPIHPNEL